MPRTNSSSCLSFEKLPWRTLCASAGVIWLPAGGAAEAAEEDVEGREDAAEEGAGAGADGVEEEGSEETGVEGEREAPAAEGGSGGRRMSAQKAVL